jgi:hypothetical protein
VQYSGLGHEKNHKNIQKAKKHSIYNGQWHEKNHINI